MNRQLLLKAGIFSLVLIALAAGVEAVLSYQHRDGKNLIGIEVFEALREASTPHPEVTDIYLGDSVAHQIFTGGSKQLPNILSLPCNQAISMAGQYLLLQKALAQCPKTKKVFLFLRPSSFCNNLDQPYTNDYFCAYFHNQSTVWEVWQVKHDYNFLKDHLLRMLVPNIMATNSWLNHSSEVWQLQLKVRANHGKSTPVVDEPPSPISMHYLTKMRELCRSRGVALFILPCPCPATEKKYASILGLFDAPVRIYDETLFFDGIHFKPGFLTKGRQQVLTDFGRFGVQVPVPISTAINVKTRH